MGGLRMARNNVIRIFCMVIMLTLLASAAWAAGTSEAQYLQGGENRENALLVTEEQYAQKWMAHVRTNMGTGKSPVEPWYVLEANQASKLTLSVWNTANTSIRALVYNMTGNMVFEKAIYLNEELHQEFEMVAGEKLYVLLATNEPFLDGTVNFAVCFDGFHIEQVYTETATEATCRETGLKVYPCALCFSWYRTEEIPALGHVETDPEVVELASCMQAGRQVVKCGRCEQVISETELPMEKHVYGRMETVSPATCIENGYGEQRCINCNVLIASEKIPAYGHKGGEWQILNPAACTADGLRVQYCTYCGITMQQETVKAFGHSIGEWETVREASCEQSGLKEKKCSGCNAVLESEAIDALGHRYTEWETITEATKECEGEKMRHCIGCGDTQSQSIEKLERFLGVF